MVNNYDAVLACINAFLIANAPPGAERDLARVKRQLDAGDPSAFIGIEFRPTDDVGAQLYVRVDDPNGRFDSARIMDAEGNRWYAYVVRCEVSWASWGSSDVATCQRRVACMAEVVRFAAEVERAFLLSYAETVAAGDARLYGSWSAAQRLLELFVLEKALYELRYELAHRPDWVALPLLGILAALGATPGGN